MIPIAETAGTKRVARISPQRDLSSIVIIWKENNMSQDKLGEKEPRSLAKVHESGDEAKIR